MATHAARVTWFVVGIAALALGGLGVVLPLLPTTPFVLVAAFAFAKSSKRLHAWLLDHEIFGKLISNWQRYGAISRSAKIAGIASMAAVLLFSVVLAAPTAVIIVQAIVLSCSALFVATRPLPPR